MKIAAIVVEPNRFKNKGHFWAYCGLVSHKKMSGGRSYGKRKPRYSRALKSVFKTAAMAVTFCRSENSMKAYYEFLISEGMAQWKARHNLARKIAAIAFTIMKSGRWYNANEINKYFGGEPNGIVSKDSRD